MDEVHSTNRARRRARLIKLGGVTAGVAAAALALSACSSSSNSSSSGGGGGTSGGGGGGKKVGVSLILKTLTNPYFVSMEKDAKTAASQNNVNLSVAAGKTDGDTQTQIAAIDNAISRGDKGILITINGDAVNTEISKARKAGLYVIALDTAPTPPDTVDITYATDNEQAGKLIGQYGAAKLNGQKATIAMLDLFNTQVVSVDIQRDHGFLEGMGIDPGSKTENGKEAKTGHYTSGKGGDYEVACHQPTQGDIPHGKTAMENCLSANSNINVVYTINEPAADGAYQALQAAGKANSVTVLTIDGSCKYVKNFVGSKFAADSAQYPGKMASLGVESIAKLANGGAKPTTSNGLSFFNTGTNLVAKDAMSGVTSQTPDVAAKDCWGSS
jgi:fructose transport system substrate-binding protein